MASLDSASIFPLRANFFIGNYQEVLQKADNPEFVDSLVADFYVQRANIELGNTDSLAESEYAEGSLLWLVSVYSKFLTGEIDLDGAKRKLLSALVLDKSVGELFLAYCCFRKGLVNEALEVLTGEDDFLERYALRARIYLRINRQDLASAEVLKMQQKNDVDPLTMLVSCWLNQAQGGASIQEALYTYKELANKFGNTSYLLNSQGSCKMQQLKFDEAMRFLVEANQLSFKDADCLANIVVCAQHLGKKPEFTQRYLSVLRKEAPNHPVVQKVDLVDRYLAPTE